MIPTVNDSKFQLKIDTSALEKFGDERKRANAVLKKFTDSTANIRAEDRDRISTERIIDDCSSWNSIAALSCMVGQIISRGRLTRDDFYVPSEVNYARDVDGRYTIDEAHAAWTKFRKRKG